MELVKKIFGIIPATLAFIRDYFKSLIFLLILFLIFAPTSGEEIKTPNLQRVVINGPIFTSEEIVELLDKATKDRDIKGILVDINSPGGAVAPSIEIAYAIKRARESKPVVVYASGLLASGGYYASIWANKIVANPGAMIGSIGVIIQGMNVESLMEKVGVKTQVIKAGKYKQIGTMDREWSEFEKEELDKIVKGTYDLFVSDVISARALNISEIESFADAKVFIASQAKEVKLIDQIGVLHDAKNILATLSGVSEPVWNSEDKLDKFLHKLSTETLSMIHTYSPSIVLK